MLVFETVRFKNFLSYGNQFTEIPLNRHTTTQVMGDSGSGKSTLVDAIVFALFGKPYRPSNKPSVVNFTNNKDCLVELEFTKAGHRYMIRRGLKPTVFQVYRDSELISEDAAMKDYQRSLEDTILQFSHRAFCQVVVAGSASFVPFMELSASDRRSFVEEVLGISLYSVIQSLAKQDIAELKSRLDSLNLKRVEIKARIETLERLRNEMQQDSEAERKAVEDELVREREILSGIETEIRACLDLIEAFELPDESVIQTDLDKLKSFNTKFNEKRKSIDKQLSVLAAGSCPSCEQEITEEYRSMKREAIASEENRLSEATNLLRDKMKEANEKLANYKTKRQELETIKQKSVALKSKYAIQKTVIDGLSKKQDSLNNAKTLVSDDEINHLSGRLSDIMREHANIMDQARYLTAIVEIFKDSGIRTKVIRQYLPEINKRVAYFLEELELPVQFNFDENFNETILAGYREDLRYSSFSEGEKARISFALLMTWREIAARKFSLRTNLFILDEVFLQSLDVASLDKVLGIFEKQASQRKENIFIIGHRQDLIGKTQHDFMVTKVNGFSRVSGVDNE